MSGESNNCVIYIDYGNLATKLNRQRIFQVPIEAIVEAFSNEASRYGKLKSARVFADWARHNGAGSFENLGYDAKFTFAGERNAYSVIRKDVNLLLRSELPPRNFIFVVNENEYIPLFTKLRRRDHRVILWAFTDQVTPKLINCSDSFTPLNDILELDVKRDTLSIPPSSILTSLVITLDTQMAELGTTKLPRPQCIEILNNKEHFSPDGQMWLNQAIEEKAIIQKAAPYDTKLILCSLDDNHPKVQRALEIRDRLLLTLDAALQGRRWIAFNNLERYMRSQKIFGENESSRRIWIELLITENLIVAEKLDNPKRPDLPPTTALTLNQDHPIMQEIPKLINNQLRRLVVIVHNFLINRGYKWIAASTLLKFLGRYLTQASAQWVFSIALDANIILLEKMDGLSQDNHAVSIVKLNQQNKLVYNTLEQLNRAIRILERTIHERQSGLSYSVLLSTLRENNFGHSDDYRRFWLDILIRTQVLTQVKSIGYLASGKYTLDRSLPVVFSAINQTQE